MPKGLIDQPKKHNKLFQKCSEWGKSPHMRSFLANWVIEDEGSGAAKTKAAKERGARELVWWPARL